MSGLYETFRKFSMGYCEMIQIKKQTNKQTNKHLLDPKYLSQINSDLHKTFRRTSRCYHKIIQINTPTNRKQFCELKISQQNQVRSSRNFQGIFLWVSEDY